MNNILVIGALGQLGSELTKALRQKATDHTVFASDISAESDDPHYLPLDVTDAERLDTLVKKHDITVIYHLAAVLSAKGESNPQRAWDINMQGLLNVLETARKQHLKQVYWPSSIAAFGPTTPRNGTQQHTIAEPTTVYGISKLAGELWCQYYHRKYNIDVRSLRYPGLISATPPGGGTTDYAVDIFYKAVEGEEYTCFLKEDSELPMMYMPDAIRATIELMEAPAEAINVRTSYNLQGFSITPAELFAEIKKYKPSFRITYAPDFRQQIADSWPASIDDSTAKRDWQWQAQYDVKALTIDMLKKLEARVDQQV